MKIYKTFFDSSQNKIAGKIAREMLFRGLFEDYNIIASDKDISILPHGKPYLKKYPNIFFSISHCDGCAVCAIASAKIGVDAEKIREYRPRVAHRVFSAGELAFLNSSESLDHDFTMLWTLKESYVKAIGTGLSYPLKSVEFSFGDSQINSNKSSHTFTILEEKGYIISICIEKQT